MYVDQMITDDRALYRCPFCGSDNFREIDLTDCYREAIAEVIECRDCQGVWENIFRFEHSKVVRLPVVEEDEEDDALKRLGVL